MNGDIVMLEQEGPSCLMLSLNVLELWGLVQNHDKQP